MISPARFPNWLKSTGATSPLSLKSTVMTCLWFEVDHRSSLSFSFGLVATGTPDCWEHMIVPPCVSYLTKLGRARFRIERAIR
jgi:hypothetical protein